MASGRFGVYKDYLEAGADIINTNTFGANGLKFHKGTEFELAPIIQSAAANAKEAVRQSGKEAFIMLDLGPTGKLLKPLGDLDFEDAVVKVSKRQRMIKVTPEILKVVREVLDENG